MSPWITGAILALGAAAVGEAIWIMGQNRSIAEQNRLFLTYAKQLLAVGADNVAKLPRKSAAPTPQPEPHTEPIAVVKAEPVDEWRRNFTFKPSPERRSDA